MNAIYLQVCFGVVGLCLAAMAVRFVLGPTLHDRLVALESMSIGLLAGVALWSISYGELWMFDVILVLALVGFLSTVAVARFVEQGDIRDD